MTTCCYCHQTFGDTTALRPYGPDGAPTCLPCALSPQNVEATATAYVAVLDDIHSRASANGGVNILTFTDAGPVLTLDRGAKA